MAKQQTSKKKVFKKKKEKHSEWDRSYSSHVQ